MGLDINFFKAKRTNYDAYNEAHKKWTEEKPVCTSMSHEKYQKQIDDWYKKEPSLERHGVNDAGYFRKVNFLVSFFDYSENCEFQEISETALEDLKSVTDKLSDIKPYRRVRHYYPINKVIEKSLDALKDEEKANLDVPAFVKSILSKSNVQLDSVSDELKEKYAHWVKVALKIEKPKEGTDYWVEGLYRKTDKEYAEDLLPTTSGFFFGNTDYDHGYWEDVKAVNEWVTNLLADLAEDEMVLMYCWW